MADVMYARALAANLALFAVGCGSSSSRALPVQGPDSGSMAATDATAGGVTDDAPVFASPAEAAPPFDAGCPATTPMCPASPPSRGDPCTAPFGFHCEYGDDPLPYCNIDAWCDPGAGWLVALPVPSGDAAPPQCPTTPQPSCPPTFQTARAGSAPCSGNSLQCIYPEGTCDCAPSGAGATWVCSPAAAPNCPVTRPRYGTPCSSTDVACSPWGGGCGTPTVVNAQCQCGTWQPVSCINL